MRIILFTPPAHLKIINLIKTMTARCWKQRPPRVGETVRAQTGRRKETAFALLKITNVHRWDGDINGNAAEVTGIPRETIAHREGFNNWQQFIEAYYSLNAYNFLEGNRTHYFIEFELIEVL